MSQVYFNHTSKLEVVKQGLVPPTTIALKKEGLNFIYGIAICSKYDNFSKKHGREIAANRMENRFRTTEIPKEMLKSDLTEKQMCLIFLYQLAFSVTLKNKSWKKKITRFNINLKTPVISINKKYDSDPNPDYDKTYSVSTTPKNEA